MDDATREIRDGEPRVPRVRRSKKEQQAHVREVLLALGGSPDEFDRTNDSSDKSATVGSRVAAYTRFTSSTASAPAPPPTATPIAAEPLPRPTRRAARPKRPSPVLAVARGLRRPIVALVHSLLRAVVPLVRLLPRLARALARALVQVAAAFTAGLKRSLVRARDAFAVLGAFALRAATAFRRALLVVLHAARLVAGVLLNAVVRLAHAVPRAAAALKPAPRSRSVRRRTDDHEPEHVAEAVMAWVQPRPRALDESPSTIESTERPSPAEISEPDVQAVEAPPSEAPPRRTRRGGLTVLASLVVVAVVAGVFVPLQQGDDDAAPTRSASGAAGGPEPVPSRSEFSDAREYGAAMTRLALTSGRTEIDGQVTCAQDSTFERWSCQARGKPSLGSYAGRWLTYRCTPTATPQPGGAPDAVMINCTPQKPQATG